jgi:predicted dehydrogenase
MNRRTFLQSVGASAVAIAAAPTLLRAADASTAKYTTALVGSGWWGMNILRVAIEAGQSKVVAICDPDGAQADKSIAEVTKLNGDTPKKYTDYRELLEKEKPQLVINATPDHWHALITIDACKSGANVYVEKPISHTILEGAAMVKTARATDRVVQVGTHRRVSPHNISAREFVRSGKVGKIGMVRCFAHSGGGSEKIGANIDPPKDMDWDLWCGPAPLRPFNKKIHSRGFRQFLDYANGQLGDWGVHWLDQMLWIMDPQHPRTVHSTGGRLIKGPPINSAEGQTSDAPDTQLVTYQFENFTGLWDHRQYAANNAEKDEGIGCYFYGTEGTLQLGWSKGWTFYPADGGKKPIHEDAQLTGPNGDNIKESWADFLDAIKNKRRSISDIETGHRATTCALLGMLSLKLGRSVKWDGENHAIANDPEATALLKRPYRGEWKYPEV